MKISRTNKSLTFIICVSLLTSVFYSGITGCKSGAPEHVTKSTATKTQEEILGPTELHYLSEALRCIKMTPQDLLYDKNKSPGLPFRLKSVDELMANPIQVPFYTDRLARDISGSEPGQATCDAQVGPFACNAQDSLTALITRLSTELDLTLPRVGLTLSDANFIKPLANDNAIAQVITPDNFFNVIRQTDNMQPELVDALVILIAGMNQSDDLLDEAFANLSDEAKKNIKEHGDSFEAYGGYDTISREKLAGAGLLIAQAIEAALTRLNAVKSAKGKPAAEFGLDEKRVKGNILFYAKTNLGDIIIGGSSKNEYYDDFSLIVDIGGDDKYTGRAGGTDGRVQPPIAVCIDLGGDNEFIARMADPKDLPKTDESDKFPRDKIRIDFCQGAAVYGIGILVVKGNGDNTFVAGNWSQGAAHLGVGILKRIGKGNDSYQGLDCVQGAASFGIGILQDEKGDDKYKATFASQGFGAVAGVGLLQDKSGDDNYYAGGRYEDFPQRPKGSFIAMSQGFGYGLRPGCSGGLGILIDNAGDDYYKLDNQFGIGGSYWYGYGVFVDDAGDDTYQTGKTGKDGDYDGYTMGAAIHLTVACMIDRAGDDKYNANRIGPAVGWDLSPGWLIDGGGDDVFSTHKVWNWMGGVQNGCGFLVKKSGHAKFDVYHMPSGQIQRDCGSIGIVLNLGGDGEYTSVISPLMKANSYVSGHSWSEYENWGAGIDTKADKNIPATEGLASWPRREPKLTPVTKIEPPAPALENTPAQPSTQEVIGAARQLMEQNDYTGAYALLNDAWINDPYNPDVNYELAACYAFWDAAGALNHLAIAAKNGYADADKYKNDERLAPLYYFDYLDQYQAIEAQVLMNKVNLNPESLEKLWQECAKEQGSNWDKSTVARDKFKTLGLPALPFALSKLTAENYYEYAWASDFIMSLGKSALPGLIAKLNQTDKATQRGIITLLGQIGDPKATKHLVTLLTNPDLRDIIIVALGSLKDRTAVPHLLALQNDTAFIESEALRKLLAVSLGKIADPAAVPYLASLLDDSYFWVRYPAQNALVQIGEPAVMPLIEKVLLGKFPANAHAIEALGAIKDTRAYDILEKQTASADWAIRAFAIEALGNLGAKQSADVIGKIKKSEKHPFVLHKIEQAMLKLK